MSNRMIIDLEPADYNGVTLSFEVGIILGSDDYAITYYTAVKHEGDNEIDVTTDKVYKIIMIDALEAHLESMNTHDFSEDDYDKYA